MRIENNEDCFVKLWLLLESTRRAFKAQQKRFCVRNVISTWHDEGIISYCGYGKDDFIYEVCMLSEHTGYDELLPPLLYPRRHRELLRAIVAVSLGIGVLKVHLKELDTAYSVAFPKATPLNVNKKKRAS